MLSVLVFYGSLIFGLGFGMVALFRIGRLGWTQFARWLRGVGAMESGGGLIVYWSSIFGRILSKLWLLLGLPMFALDVLLTLSGHGYTPQWLNDTDYEGVGVILAAYLAAYMLGRAFGSRHRDFNRARLLYESVVASKGYWFDHRASSSHYYADTRVRNALQTSESLR